jgi:hypothetical protein
MPVRVIKSRIHLLRSAAAWVEYTSFSSVRHCKASASMKCAAPASDTPSAVSAAIQRLSTYEPRIPIVKVSKTFFSRMCRILFSNFIELEPLTLWALCRAIIDRRIMCQCLRNCLKVRVIISEQLRNHNNYIPIEQPTFQSAAAHPPVSLGQNVVSKCQARSLGLPAVLRLRNSDFKKNRRNVFRIGTYIRPKINLRIGEHVGIFQ